MNLHLTTRSTVLFAIVLSVFMAVGCKKDSKEETFTPASLTGSWKYGTDIDSYIIKFDGVNVYEIMNLGVSIDKGTYSIDIADLTLNATISQVCTNTSATVKYKISIKDNKLDFANIDDDCVIRKEVLIKGDYIKQ